MSSWLPRQPLVALFLAPLLVLAACTGSINAAQSAAQPTEHSVFIQSVPCSMVILPDVKSSQALVGQRVVLGVVTAPPPYFPHPVKLRGGRWRYWQKWGPFTRSGNPPVLVTVPPEWQQRAAIKWGSTTGIATGTVRLPSCPGSRGTWNGYAGGFFLRSSSACLPLVFQVQRRTTIVRIGIGRHCGK